MVENKFGEEGCLFNGVYCVNVVLNIEYGVCESECFVKWLIECVMFVDYIYVGDGVER